MTAKEALALAVEKRPERIKAQLSLCLEAIKNAASTGITHTDYYPTMQEVKDKLVEMGYRFESIGGNRNIITWG